MNLKRITKNLYENKPCIGVHCYSEDIGFYEMCGLLGYDYVWIDNEHAGLPYSAVRNGIIAANAKDCSAFVRVRTNEPSLVKPYLEMGPDGIIFPMILSAEEADKAVKSCMYPPYGTRGFGPLRAADYSVLPDMQLEEYSKRANKTIMKILQIEHVEAVKNLDEILEVPGIDLIICGPMDLSASVGKMGMFNDPEVLEMMMQIIKKSSAAEIKYGVSIGYNMELIRFWLENGASFVSVGNPYDFFNIMSKKVLCELR